MGGKKRGPSGPSVEEQYQSEKAGYASRARDVAAEGGGLVDVTDPESSNAQAATQRRFGNKQGALDSYRQRMEAKFKGAGTAPGNIRDQQAKAGAGAGSTNVAATAKPQQILGEEEKRRNSLFV